MAPYFGKRLFLHKGSGKVALMWEHVKRGCNKELKASHDNKDNPSFTFIPEYGNLNEVS